VISPAGTEANDAASASHARALATATDRRDACGRRPDATTTCGGGRWRTALDCTGRGDPSEGPTVNRMLAAWRIDESVPFLRDLLEHPWGHRLFGLRAGYPVALMNRSRPSFRHRPAKDGTFRKTGVPFTLENPGGRGSLPRPPDRYHPLRRRPALGRRTALQSVIPAPLVLALAA